MDKNEIGADTGADVDAGNRVEGPQEAQEGALPVEDVNTSGLEEKALREADNGVREQKTASKVKKKHGKGVLIGFLVFLMLIGVGFGVAGMVLWWQERNKPIEKIIEERTEVVEKVTEVDKTTTAGDLKLSKEKFLSDNKDRGFVIDNSINTVEETGVGIHLGELMGGAIGCDGQPIAVNDVSDLQLDVDWTRLDSLYDLNLPKERLVFAEDTVDNIDANHVVDTMVGVFGMSARGALLLFLMDDGTVEYASVETAAQTGEFRSQGKISGVESVIKFYQVMAMQGCDAGATVLAQKANGEFYDLYGLLEAQNAWGWQ